MSAGGVSDWEGSGADAKERSEETLDFTDFTVIMVDLLEALVHVLDAGSGSGSGTGPSFSVGLELGLG